MTLRPPHQLNRRPDEKDIAQQTAWHDGLLGRNGPAGRQPSLNEITMIRKFVRPTIIFITILLISSSLTYAEDAQLNNIIVTNTRDDLLLYLTAKEAFPPIIDEAIHSGVPTTFTFYINLCRVRGLWLDKEIANIKLSHTIKYDTVKKEYTVSRSWEGDRPLTTKSLEEAKAVMTEVDSLAVIPLEKLKKGQQYQIRTKAELSRKTLPFYLHYILFFVSFWDLETDWYTIDFIY